MSTLKRISARFKLGSTLTLLALVVVWSLPTLGLLITSLRRRSDAEVSPWWDAIFDPLGTVWSTDAYQTALESGMLDALVNTFAVTIPATILPLMVAANAAYAFTFLNFKGKEVVFSLMVGLMVVPLQAALIPVLRGMVWLQKAVDIQLTGTYASAWIVHSAFAMPLAIYIIRNYMLTIPTSLIEAARIDGASYYKIFWSLVLPLSMPAIASFAIFQFLWVWNDYLIAFIFVGQGSPV
ncbi:MAG: carbohydrate ABC transporter permease, partial [Aquiluna sp.]|nr:carbohydrate ABC transporter permease [Aquiluna sp.]